MTRKLYLTLISVTLEITNIRSMISEVYDCVDVVVDQDTQIAQESLQYKITGGCTALVAMFFMGKLYVANAGDCR